MMTEEQIRAATSTEKAAVERAKDKLRIADKAYDDARTASNEARMAWYRAMADASGLRDHVVEFEVHQGYGRGRKKVRQRMIVDSVIEYTSMHLQYEGRAVKVDGTVGIARRTVDVGDPFTDLGIHQSRIEEAEPAD